MINLKLESGASQDIFLPIKRLASMDPLPLPGTHGWHSFNPLNFTISMVRIADGDVAMRTGPYDPSLFTKSSTSCRIDLTDNKLFELFPLSSLR